MQVSLVWIVLSLLVITTIVGVSIIKRCNLKNTIESLTPIILAKSFIWIILGVILLIAVVFGLYLINFKGNLSINNSDWGTFGDYIGGTLNPILSFLSLIALLTTIVLQSKELDLTRTELSRSAKAQEDTKEILDKQSETLARQQFESTFFSLLDQHNKMLESLTTPRSNTLGSKLDLIMSLVFDPHCPDIGTAKLALESKNDLCGHYFRVLYQLLKFIATNAPGSPIGKSFEVREIDNKTVSDDEKMYSNIARLFLGYRVTQLLAINCYSKDETDTYWRYKLLIERYAFLEHMPFEIGDKESSILNKTKKFYKSSAFGNSNFVKMDEFQ